MQNSLSQTHCKNSTENLNKYMNKQKEFYLQKILKKNGSIDSNSIGSSAETMKTTKNNIESIFSSEETRKKAIKYIIQSHKNDKNSNPLYYKLNKSNNYTLDKDPEVLIIKDDSTAIDSKLPKKNINIKKLDLDKKQRTYNKIQYSPIKNNPIKINKKQKINFKKSLKIQNLVETNDVSDIYQDQDQSGTSRDKYNAKSKNSKYNNLANGLSEQKNNDNDFDYIPINNNRLITDIQPTLYVNSTNLIKTGNLNLNKPKTFNTINYNKKVSIPKLINKKLPNTYINNKIYSNPQNSKNLYIHRNVNSGSVTDFLGFNDMNITHTDNFQAHNETLCIYPSLTEGNNTFENMNRTMKPFSYKPKQKTKNKIKIINNNKAIKIFNISFNDDLIDREEEEIMNQKQIEQQVRQNKIIMDGKKNNKNNEVNHSLVNNFVNSSKFNNNVKNLSEINVLKYNTINNNSSNLTNNKKCIKANENYMTINASKENVINKKIPEKILFKKRPIKEISKDCIDNKEKKTHYKINNLKKSIINKNIHELIIIQKNKYDVEEIKITDYKSLGDINNKLREKNFKVDNKEVVLCTVEEISEKKKLINEIKSLRQKNDELKYYLLTDNKNDYKNLEKAGQFNFGISKNNK